ncbi:MAG TPA: hypothetical protein VHW00_13870 [Thermoanaerobaculia bacterium]|nr:hypothetical protein [Thermoanaerobaculia bacterium]
MNDRKPKVKSRRNGRREQRGSALLVSLMILVGLTLLGLAFVAVSQTESAISMTQKNYTQTLQVAEAGALRAVDWFQNPEWADRQGILPPNNDAIKVIRIITNVTPNYNGRYKSGATDLLFDKPFRTALPQHRLYGTETNPDVWINQTTAEAAQASMSAANDFLTIFNIKLFNTNNTLNTMDNNEGGVITDIRVYAPPVENATINAEAGWTSGASGAGVNATGFIEGGTRFGVATVRVTATKFDPPCTQFPCTGAGTTRRVVATRTVKVTIAEWPFPGPQGPVQTNANLNTSGNIQVHWGKTTSNGDMTMAKTYAGIPWADAWDMAHWEHGYDSSIYPSAFTSDWPHVATTNVKDTKNYLYELVGQAYPDPWWQMRARGSLNIKGITDPTPYDYTYGDEPDDSTVNRSNWFQDQTQNTRPDRQNVLFPRIDYNFWKQLAITADDEPNIYYLRWVSGETFQDKFGRQRTFREWVDITSNPPANTGPKSVPGFYFFDTRNQSNPQNGQGGILTPEIDVQGGTMQAKGFLYINAEGFGTKGLGGVNEWVNMPGEPFRDIGFPEIEEDSTVTADYKGYKRIDSSGAACVPNIGTNCVIKGAFNGEWDFQDLAWSNTNSGKNNIFDFFVDDVPAANNSDGTLLAGAKWFIVPYSPTCNPGVNCSEPHEPYLNLIYPTVPTGNTIASWYDPAVTSANLTDAKTAVTVRRPKITSGGAPVACVAESTVILANRKVDRENCTSNGYDKDGGLVQLEISMNGVFYNEGTFDATGNAIYFGSVLAEGNAEKAGNPDIYFDERLVKGAWPPGNFGFPRVYITSEQTDQ